MAHGLCKGSFRERGLSASKRGDGENFKRFTVLWTPSSPESGGEHSDGGKGHRYKSTFEGNGVVL